MRERALSLAAAFLLAASVTATGAETARARVARGEAAGPAIDRRALVRRHDPRLAAVDPTSPFSVGNGRFTFTVDVTGLQSLGDVDDAEGTPLATLARWAWHSEPNPAGYTLGDVLTRFDSPAGPLLLPTNAATPAGEWLRRNPQILPLARIGLMLAEPGSRGASDLFRPIRKEDLTDVDQRLDLWTGHIESRYRLQGVAVRVETAVHPTQDTLAIRVESPLLVSGRLRVRVAFPRGYRLDVKNSPPLDWTEPRSHTTRVIERGARRLELERVRDATRLRVGLAWGGHTTLAALRPEQHELLVAAADPGPLELSVAFSPSSIGVLPSAEDTLRASRRHWPAFWRRGGAVDLRGSTDPRAPELERRIVLSQYLTAIQSAAEVPPQESGLLCSTWYGKHHTEMIFWHTAHFALWGREDLLARNLEWYRERLPAARQLAAERGLRGARWPKMVGPEGRESPGGNPLIVWNQPQPIHLSELLYRAAPSRATLERYGELVQETAEALASMVHLDAAHGTYSLGPPLWISQEIYDPATSRDPAFELAYWSWALETAQRWRERAGRPRVAEWDEILARLAPLPMKDGLYVALGSQPDTFDNLESRHDHPTMLAALGLLPGKGVEAATMRRTLHAVLERWDFATKVWGWDYPMIAMTAARLGEPETAVEILLRDGPNNTYLGNGHCPQRSDVARRPGEPAGRSEIPAYLPANGALLSAVAMMAAGWDGAPPQPAPGFPREGWKVRYEGLRPLP
jgi:hypothetical protein